MADNPTGTPVTLVVTKEAVPVTPPPPSHLPHTGFELTAALLLAVLLLALGATLTTLGRPLTYLRRNS
jgi:hypothetical protein